MKGLIGFTEVPKTHLFEDVRLIAPTRQRHIHRAKWRPFPRGVVPVLIPHDVWKAAVFHEKGDPAECIRNVIGTGAFESAEHIELDVDCLRMPPDHPELFVDQVIICNVVECKRKVSVIVGGEEHFAFPFGQESFVKALLELEGASGADQFLENPFPLGEAEEVVIEQTDFPPGGVIEFRQRAMLEDVVEFLIDAEGAFSETATRDKADAVVGVFLELCQEGRFFEGTSFEGSCLCRMFLFGLNPLIVEMVIGHVVLDIVWKIRRFVEVEPCSTDMDAV